MKLSERAKTYLENLNRNSEFVTSEKETIEYLKKQDLGHLKEFIKFQNKYSGYELTIKNDSYETFEVSLFSKEQIEKGLKLEIDKVDNKLIEVCGHHNTAQFYFFLTENGEFCTEENDTLNILRSNFSKVIEEYALRNEISEWKFDKYYYEIENIDSLNKFMNIGFKIIEECTDKYSTWWKNENIIAVKGVWLDRPEYYFHIYSKNGNEYEYIIKELRKQKIIK